MYQLSARSRKALHGVHADLVRVVERAIAITTVDFVVLQGLRSKAEQQKAVASGNSWTMKSRHLTGHAVDVAPWVNGGIDWNDLSKFEKIRNAFFAAADELGVMIRWGGDWNENGSWRDEIKRGSYDGGHFELHRKAYP